MVGVGAGTEGRVGKIVVTRSKAFQNYAVEIGVADEMDPVFERVNDDIVAGNDVVGTIPLRLAAAANTVTEIPLFLPRGVHIDDLDMEGIRRYAKAPRKYIVKEI